MVARKSKQDDLESRYFIHLVYAFIDYSNKFERDEDIGCFSTMDEST